MGAIVLGMMGTLALAILLTLVRPGAGLVGAILVVALGAGAIASAVLSAAAGKLRRVSRADRQGSGEGQADVERPD